MGNLSNTELVTEFMEFGSPLNQAFVMEAITRYSKQVIEQQDELRESMINHMIHPDAWIRCAEDFKELYDKERK